MHFHPFEGLKEYFLGCELDSTGSEESPDVGFCKYGDATSGSYKAGSLDHLKDPVPF